MTSALGFGTSWDDGAHGDVKKMIIKYDHYGINMVQFHYLDGDQTLVGEEHGKDSVSAETTIKEFDLEPDEHITEVIAHTAYAVRMLEFTTNKRSMECGAVVGPNYEDSMYLLEKKTMFTGILTGEKIVGFHGISGNFLHQFGAHLAPI